MVNTTRRHGTLMGLDHIGIGVCLLVLVVFAILNLDNVRIDFAVATVDTPLVVLIAISALLGFVIGWFIGRRRHSE